MSKFIMMALPGYYRVEPGYPGAMKTVSLKSFATGSGEATTVEQVKHLIADFGQRTAEAHPLTSFYVSVALRSGPSPRGLKAAEAKNELGADRWMKTITNARTVEPETV